MMDLPYRDDIRRYLRRARRMPLSHWLVEYGSPVMVCLLHKLYTIIDGKKAFGNTLLFQALHYNKIDITLALIKAGADVNGRCVDGLTPLHVAGSTPLHNADNAEKTRMLLEAGADVNARNEDGSTPIHLFHNVEVARMLLEAGADINAKDKNAQTPVFNQGYHETVKSFLRAGANPDAKDKDGNTPLHVLSDNFLKLKSLLLTMHDVSEEDVIHDIEKTTSSHEVAHVLVEAGADVNIKNNDGKNPLHCAREAGHRKLAQVLWNAGATP